MQPYEIKRNPSRIVEKLRLPLRKPRLQTPQAKGENACHITEPTGQRRWFSVVVVVFSDSFSHYTRVYLLAN